MQGKIKHRRCDSCIIWRERVMYVKNCLFYPAGSTPSIRCAAEALRRRGCDVASRPGTDVTHLLLPVPSLDSAGALRGGGALPALLAELPKNVTVFGGNLNTPLLAGYKVVDLLQDPLYLAENAAITAHCAVRTAVQRLPVTLQNCPVLVIGWGRIGKCLAALLQRMGARVTVAARKESDRAMLSALGFAAIDPAGLRCALMRYRVIFNTVPVPLLSEAQQVHCRPDCLKIDLASVQGIAGTDVIWARGLPGKDAPESAGELIAQTVFRLAAAEVDV